MRDIKINKNGEFLFEGNDFSYGVDDRIVVQDVKLTLKNIRNDYWDGCNLEQYIGNPKTERIKTQIKDEIKDEILKLDYLNENNIKVAINEKDTTLTIEVAIDSPITKRKFKISTDIKLNSSEIE